MRQKQKGYTLVIVIIMTAVLAILGVSLLNVALADAKQADRGSDKAKAHNIARSGVYVAINMVDNLVATKKFTDLTQLKQELDAQNLNLMPDERKVGVQGSFSLEFINDGPGRLKIKSTGSTGGADSVSATVTYSVNISLPAPSFENPTTWVRGDNNLSHQTTATEHSFIRKIVSIDGKTTHIKIPQGSGDYPVFQASSIRFVGDSGGFCVEQVKNSAPPTFDTQILYFENKILLSESGEGLNLSVSDTVLSNWLLPSGAFIDVSGEPENKQGFAGVNGYGRFVDGFDDKLFTTNSLVGRYGLVYFGGNIYRTTNGNNYELSKNVNGWYFFKNGTNLKDIQSNDLIEVRPNDAVIQAATSILSFKGGTSDQIWDDK